MYSKVLKFSVLASLIITSAAFANQSYETMGGGRHESGSSHSGSSGSSRSSGSSSSGRYSGGGNSISGSSSSREISHGGAGRGFGYSDSGRSSNNNSGSRYSSGGTSSPTHTNPPTTIPGRGNNSSTPTYTPPTHSQTPSRPSQNEMRRSEPAPHPVQSGRTVTTVDSRNSRTVQDRGLQGFFKPNEQVQVRHHKDGGFTEFQGDKKVVYRANGSRQVINDGKITSYNREGRATNVQEQIRGSDGRSIGTKKTVLDAGGKVAVEKNYYNRDGLHLREYHNTRTGVRYNENIRVVNNTRYVDRTYVRNNVTYVRNYRTYVYGGYNYQYYSPSSFWAGYWTGFAAGVYFNPWNNPYYYTWSWNDPSWYGWYGYYWRPRPYYVSAADWLVDYSLSAYLIDHYANLAAEERAQARASQAVAQEAMNENIKRQIAEQVKIEMNNMKSKQASTPIEQVLGTPNRLFIVDDEINVTNMNDDTPCELSQGDILQLTTPISPTTPATNVRVVTAKASSCSVGSVVTVATTDLLDMHNTFSEKVESGIEEMCKKGINGAPTNCAH